MKIIFDTNTVVRAIYRPKGPAARVVSKALELGHHSIVSTFLLDEIDRVLEYPRVKALAQNSEPEQQAALEIFRASSYILEPDTNVHVSTDLDDNPIIALASFASVNVICTRDKHFHQPLVQLFLKSRNIQVMDEIELLKLIDSTEPPNS